MESKSSYPSDYRRALENAFTTEGVDNSLNRPGGLPPFFVFGVLMLPTVLKYVIDTGNDFDVVSKMVQATALDHRLYQMEDADLPAIQPTSELGQSVDGFLVFGLDPKQRGKVYEFESGLTKLDTVQVEICQKDGGLRTLDAGAFVWAGEETGLKSSTSRSWKVDGFLKTDFYAYMVKSVARKGLA
jgi:hypothetical protein